MQSSTHIRFSWPSQVELGQSQVVVGQYQYSTFPVAVLIGWHIFMYVKIVLFYVTRWFGAANLYGESISSSLEKKGNKENSLENFRSIIRKCN